MSLSSPIIGRNDRYDDTPRRINCFGDSSISMHTPKKKDVDNQQQHQQQQYANEYERENGHVNRGFHDLSNKQDDSVWSPRHYNQDFAPSNKKPDLRSVKSDVTEESPFRNWPPKNDSGMLMSPGSRSTHSLQNMSSVDENEQFLGNVRGRARTLSAGAGGYRNTQDFEEITGQLNDSTHGQGTGFLNGQQIPHNQRQIGRVSSFPFSRSANNVIQEDLVHVHSQSGNEGTLLNDHFAGPRQRVMSADAVHRNGLNGLYRQPFYDNQGMIGNHSPMMHHRPSSAGDIPYNRPRSLSSGATGHGRSTRPFLDTSSSGNDTRGKFFSQMHVSIFKQDAQEEISVPV